MRKIIVMSLFFVAFLCQCEKTESIEGLWIVKNVSMGDQEVTPNGRWTRFNSDQTQESGNGWYRHSYGSWELNPEKSELSIVNTNGLKDSNAPFKVSINGNEMIWERTEEGQPLRVKLERSKELPSILADEGMGLWKLESAQGDGSFFEKSTGEDAIGILFLKWDRRFMIGTQKGRVDGVYNVHGHKPEIELIPYGEQYNRSFWNMEIRENVLTLKLLNSDSTVTRTFKRIYEFPQ